MAFFKRNKDTPLIPPVATPEPKSDPYALVPNSNKFSSGDPYARSKPSGAAGRGAGAAGSNPYERNADPADAARNELLSGYAAPEKPEPTRKYGYEGREMEEDFDEDEEVEGIKQEMRGLKQESLASTR
jgi:hypothetical protein